MAFVGMSGKPLPNPVAEIAKAPDRADLVAMLVVLDDAFAHPLDIGRIIVEVADQGPYGLERMIEHGAVIGLGHDCLRNWSPIFPQLLHGRPPDFRAANDRG
jgi:hypothetical protein